MTYRSTLMTYQILLHYPRNYVLGGLCNHENVMIIEFNTFMAQKSHDVIFWSSVLEAIVQCIQCKNKVENPSLITFLMRGTLTQVISGLVCLQEMASQRHFFNFCWILCSIITKILNPIKINIFEEAYIIIYEDENLEFDNEWDIHVSSKDYEKSG